MSNCCEPNECCCSSGSKKSSHIWKLLILAVVVWFGIYFILDPVSKYLTFDLMKLNPSSHLGSAVQFFLYDTPKVLMLLTFAVFVIGLVQTFVTPQRVRTILSGKKEWIGNIMSACLGIVTPFCSCSAVPLFVGFVEAGIPLGVTLSFLIAAPMINEVAIVLLFGLFGWKVTALYIGTGLLIAIISGWIIGRLKLERYIEDWVLTVRMDKTETNEVLTWTDRVQRAWQSVKDVVGKVWPYIIVGIAVGALIHGYVPEGLMVSIMGKGAWWSVPAAVLMGVPMYANAAGIIPIVQALLEKGAALGTSLAFMMAVIGLSLPETIILRKVLKLPLIFVFLGVVSIGIMIVGFLFNIVL